MSVLEIVLYAIIGTVVTTYVILSTIKIVKNKKNKNKENKDEDEE